MTVETPRDGTKIVTRPTAVDDPVACAFWMIVACATLAGVATIGRFLTMSGLPAIELVFLRSIIVAITLSPLLLSRGVSLFSTDQPGLYVIRVIVTSIAMITWFAALAHIPVGEVTAISFLAPLFATLGAAVILRETVRTRRWAATGIGFLGALIVLRPGITQFELGTWLAILSAVAMGASSLFIKVLSRKDDPNKIVFLTTVLMMPTTALPALFVWHWPDAVQWGFLIAIGLSATLGHVAFTRAISAADASFAMTLDFLRLPFAVFFGFIAFGEVIDAWTWLGAAIIFGAGFIAARKESRTKPVGHENVDSLR